MERRDNYAVQMQHAKAAFLTYHQQTLIRRHGLQADEDYLYLRFLGSPYRLNRHTGDLQRQEAGVWLDANTHPEVMTVLDLLCDSREDRHLSGNLKSLQSFGMQIHRSLVEEQRDPLAEAFDRNPGAFCRACEALGGIPACGGDIGYGVELAEGLQIVVHFWAGDGEFSPQLRFFFDENALQYLRYETLFFAVDLLRRRLEEQFRHFAETGANIH